MKNWERWKIGNKGKKDNQELEIIFNCYRHYFNKEIKELKVINNHVEKVN